MAMGRQWIFVLALLLAVLFRKIQCFTGMPPFRWKPIISTSRSYSLEVLDQYPIDHAAENRTIGEVLRLLDPARFPSNSQAKRACKMCSIAIWSPGNEKAGNETNDVKQTSSNAPIFSIPLSRLQMNATWAAAYAGSTGSEDGDAKFPTSPNYRVNRGDVVMTVTRTVDQFYPVGVTKYVLPPPRLQRGREGCGGDFEVVFEDEHLALVVKTENLTTITGRSSHPYGWDGEDLQSCLGFILQPSSLEPAYHPRPVHRLDRRTSGLVLVAKTQASMRRLSALFASRQIVKTYAALVLWDGTTTRDVATATNSTPTEDNHLETHGTTEEDQWRTIDYPIDGRDSVSQWRLRFDTIPGSGQCRDELGPYALLEVRPHHGRTHQIRRHLAYCLGTPIVGDAKYDKGTRHERTNGMYLCCFSLDIPYPDYCGEIASAGMYESVSSGHGERNGPCVQYFAGKEMLRVCIPLPKKFRQRLNSSGEGSCATTQDNSRQKETP
jgi:23S rRNA-/tRNA-specific pseudouridylate synthase